MGNINIITAVGRLLSCKDLRKSFVKDPEALALELGVDEDERAYFIDIDIGQLEAQAKTLVSKRFHEIKKLLPETTCRLGDKAYEYFIDYSEQYWPDGSNRHTLDACTFIKYLRSTKVNICKEEYNRLIFKSRHKKLTVSFLTSVKIRGQLRSALQIICRFSSRRYEWYLYLSL